MFLKNLENKDIEINIPLATGEESDYAPRGRHKNSKLRMVPLGGTEEIGMNMTLYIYEDGGKTYCIMVDCGVSFEEHPGSSVVMPDIKSLEIEGIVVNAVILSHGHEDHIGAVPYLFDMLKCPIYGTPFTMALVERKLQEAKKSDYELHAVNCGDSRTVGPFKIHWISVTHSIPDNAMLGIEVDKLKILHTGDWKLDDEPVVGAFTDEAGLKKFASTPVHALVCDSTNIHEEESALSEGDVGRTLMQLMKDTPTGRFVLTCFSSNVARMKSCFDAARVVGRKVVLLGNSLRKMSEVATELGFIDDADVIISEEEAKKMHPDKLMVICTGSQGEFGSALWKMTYKVQSSGALLDKGDTLVFSARIIDGKQKIVRAIINKLVERGVKVLHPWNSKDSGIHASGHPGQPDIETLWSWIKPKWIVPVHSEAEHRISHIAFAKSRGYNTFNVRNGTAIEIRQDGITSAGKFESGKLVFDGNRLIPDNHKIFSERDDLKINGFIMVSIAYQNKKIRCLISSWGVNDERVEEYDANSVDNKKKNNLNKAVRSAIENALNNFSAADFSTHEAQIRKKVVEVTKNVMERTIKKNPTIGVHIIGDKWRRP